MQIKAIIFDFDGVITESMDIKTKAFAYLFRNQPNEIIDKIIKLRLDNGGMSRYEKFKIIYQDFLNKKLSKEKEEKLAEDFSEFCYKKMITCPYVKGVEEFLEKNYKKYDFFIVSGTPHKEMNKIVGERNLQKYFKEVLGTPGGKSELTKKILKKYNLENNDVVLIGDSPNDYEGAKKTGIKFIARIPEERYNSFESNKIKVRNSINDLSSLERELKFTN